MQLLMPEKAVSLKTKIFYVDPQCEIPMDTKDRITDLLASRHLTSCDDIIFYFLENPEVNLSKLENVLMEIKKHNRCTFIIVTKEPLNKHVLPYLTLPVNGVVSLFYLVNEFEMILNTVLEKNIIIEPNFHKEILQGIEMKKNRDLPIKKLELNKEKVEGLLSQKEQDVLQLLLDGKNNREIAGKLFFAQSTINSIISGLIKKIKANDRTDAVVKTIRYGWVDGLR
ncbi:LuxR C-terminal-related transcriptional regulator [Evansella tamaricis]|uniref:LuxR C-terminal-related transcriptional regulator n=1 Tax=Evansella tamaricis TaxID=2069301 RepID=A0ABS6JIY3_9BACI|nr:LuxR C-terminal-related transcriptional regulator [Evansella tamaricis]MBU9713644.1 LuxR C-terminal-related transcriptional regulator [Evansella tamaricis]